MAKLAFTDFNQAQINKALMNRKVDPRNNPRDRICIDLLIEGKANALIRKVTGYSDGRIRYRGVWAGVDRMAYRLGIEQPYNKHILHYERTLAHKRAVDHYLKTKFPEIYKGKIK